MRHTSFSKTGLMPPFWKKLQTRAEFQEPKTITAIGSTSAGTAFLHATIHYGTSGKDLLKDDLLEKKRASRIVFNGNFYNYPLEMTDILKNVHPAEGIAILCQLPGSTAEHLLCGTQLSKTGSFKRFGQRLYATFFKPYTEKGLGHPLPRDPDRLGRPAHRAAVPAPGH
jgi:hypothetical protein